MTSRSIDVLGGPTLSDLLHLVRKNVTPSIPAHYDADQRSAYANGAMSVLGKLSDILKVLGVEIDTV